MTTVVVYVHGLWMVGLEGGLLRRRLAKDLHAETRAFAYPSVSADITANAETLAKYLATIKTDTLHLVGHSLGGLVILRLFETGSAVHVPPGRIVLLGSPIGGSRAAHSLARLPFGRKIMGIGVREELLTTRTRRWPGVRDLGVIAGNSALGLGRLVGVGSAPSDGTILVEETRVEGITAHLVLRVTHSGLPFSSLVARQAGAFLKEGRFLSDRPGDRVP